MIAGSMTTALNISPIRYTPIRRDRRMYFVGTGSESIRSLSLAL